MKKWAVRLFLILLPLVLAGAGCFIYARFIEPNFLTVTTLHVDVPEWSRHEKPLRIVFAADFHIRPNEENRLDRTVKAIIGQKPDLIILGGDFCAGHKRSTSLPIEKIAAKLAELTDAAPVFTVLGNHDAYYGSARVDRALRKAGIKRLERKNFFLHFDGKQLQLAGVPDASRNRVRKTDIPARASEDIPEIIVTHSPDAITKIPGDVSLTLAGHTHGGQINLPGLNPQATDIGNDYDHGDLDYEGKHLIVTRGLGTSILPLRFLCPPEIMVIELGGTK